MKTIFLQGGHADKRKRCRGSALLTAVIFSFLVMTLMGSYLYLSSGEYRVASRSFLSNASFNLAEGGIDLALGAIQSKNSTGWASGTDGEGRTYWARSYGDYDLGGNITGEIKIVILNPNSDTPEIFAEGVAKGHVAGDVKKQLYADLVSGFSPFKNGFNTKDAFVLNGNRVKFDSYDSRDGPYGGTNINSEITLATISVEVLNLGQADIFGYVATGALRPKVGANGSITNYGNAGAKDWSRVTTDYYAEFPDVSPPTLSSPLTSMPSSGTIMGGEYLLSSWSSNSSSPLYIAGDTTIVMTGDMSLSGNGAIEIAPNATLKIYTAGDVNLGGNGVLNASTRPEQFLIFGTADLSADQEIDIAGNGFLSSAIYAPNSEVTLAGGGTSGRVFGAIAAKDAHVTGNAHFSYDEALADLNIGGAGYEIEEWAELSGVAMTAMSLDMSSYGL